MVILALNAIEASPLRYEEGNPFDSGHVAGQFEEFQQVFTRNRGGHCIHQWMKIQPLVCHHHGVQHHCHPRSQIIYDAEGSHRSGRNAYNFG